MLGKGKKKNNNNDDIEDEPMEEQPQTATSSQGNNNNNNDNKEEQTQPVSREGFLGKIKRKTGNASKASSLVAYKTKKQTQNSMLKSKQKTRKETFGVEYIDMILSKQATAQQLQTCKEEAQRDVRELQNQIDHNVEKMNTREEEAHEQIILANGDHSTPPVKNQVNDAQPKPKTKPFWKQGNNRKEPPGRNPNKQYYPEPEGLAGR